MEEAYDSHDKLWFGDTLKEINFAGNHEAKFLLLVCLAQHEEEFLDVYEMHRAFKDFLGPEPPWTLNQTGAFQYCRHCLLPAGYVEGWPNGDVDDMESFRVTQKGIHRGVPLAGGLLRWSQDNPDLSVQHVLGPTASAGTVRAPQSSIELLSEVYTNPGSALSATDISGEPSRSDEYLNRLQNTLNAAKRLKACGLVTIEHVLDENSRQFRIKQPLPITPYQRKGHPLEPVNGFMAERLAASQLTFTFAEYFVYSLRHALAIDPRADPAEVREAANLLLNQAANREARLSRWLESLGTYNEGDETIIRPVERYRESIVKLLDFLIAFDAGDREAIQQGKSFAWEAASDDEIKAAMMAKARRFSSRANRQSDAALAPQFIGLLALRAQQGLDADAAAAAYTEEFGMRLSPNKARKCLKYLVQEGLATARKERLRDAIRSTHLVFRLALPAPVDT